MAMPPVPIPIGIISKYVVASLGAFYQPRSSYHGQKENFVGSGQSQCRRDRHRKQEPLGGGGPKCAQDVKEFWVYSDDNYGLCLWLEKHRVETVAMESTGTYWQNQFSSLTAFGFEVILVNGQQTKNIKAKKTDIKDYQWIQKLHTLGLLTGSFLPDSTTDIFRTYSRHRQGILEQSARTVLYVQKHLWLMNMRLDVGVRDITGLTGTKIITDLIGGQTSGKELAGHRHYNCQKPESEIAKASSTMAGTTIFSP